MKLITLDNFKDVSQKIDLELRKINNSNESYLTHITNSRFANGEGKVKLENSIRSEDIYILCDVGNYSISYQMHGKEHMMSPDEHFQDIKRVISATSGRSENITLIMPLLYQSRQHKRKGHESLDCALALQELENLGVDNIITFDAHDPNVSNAIPNLPFENFYPTHIILEEFIKRECIDNLLVVSPDMGAMERSRYYAEMLGCDVGVFYKRRDLSRVVNGKNPIVEHVYMGVDVRGKNIIVVDDMIASGTSMLEVASKLKLMGAHEIYFIATFALFTEGIETFKYAYKKGIFTKLYSTNLSYVNAEVKKSKWYVDVDCSTFIAKIINALHHKDSLEELHNGKLEIFEKIKEVSN